MISFNFLFENINVVLLDTKMLFLMAASVADTAAVNLKCTKTLLANDLSTFSIKDKPAFINGSRSLSKDPSNCVILGI